MRQDTIKPMKNFAATEKILWDLRDLDSSATVEQCDQLRQALDFLAKEADYLMFGVCAAEQSIGLASLASYAQHFGYELPAEVLPTLEGTVYLKFNPRSGRYYVDTYRGDYRGVLISFQSDLADGYSGTHGHFPLNLFASSAL
jgi:Domain of unknown function (DUF1824)